MTPITFIISFLTHRLFNSVFNSQMKSGILHIFLLVQFKSFSFVSALSFPDHSLSEVMLQLVYWFYLKN